MSQEDALQFGLAIVYMAGPLREVVTALPDLAEAEVACARIESVNLSLQQARRERRLPSVLPNDTGGSRIDLVDVCMRYGSTDNPKFSLPPVSLSLSRGEVVFIVGGNGTGNHAGQGADRDLCPDGGRNPGR
jgi:putative ATP-binding cassette transporter